MEMHIPRKQFEELVTEAIQGLPEEFLKRLENVAVIVEKSPRSGDYGEGELPPGTLLLGLYQGIPLTQKSIFAPMAFPDQIIIFQHPIERLCRTRQEIVAQVRRTLLHEIAHHFGISEGRLRELGC